MGRGSFGAPGGAGVPGADGGIDGVTTGRGGSFGAAGGMPAAGDGLAGLLDLDAEEFNGNIEVDHF